MKHTVSIWEVGLKATGGALTLIKSFITMALYRWMPDGIHLYGEPKEAIPIHLFPDGVPTEIETVHPDTAKEIMGA